MDVRALNRFSCPPASSGQIAHRGRPQQELAELLGITRATANAALGELQNRKLVTRGYGSIAIPDRAALALFALE